jgi:hypothetical protein
MHTVTVTDETGTRHSWHGVLGEMDLPVEPAWREVRNHALRQNPNDWLRWDDVVHAARRLPQRIPYLLRNTTDPAQVAYLAAHLPAGMPIENVGWMSAHDQYLHDMSIVVDPMPITSIMPTPDLLPPVPAGR